MSLRHFIVVTCNRQRAFMLAVLLLLVLLAFLMKSPSSGRPTFPNKGYNVASEQHPRTPKNEFLSSGFSLMDSQAIDEVAENSMLVEDSSEDTATVQMQVATGRKNLTFDVYAHVPRDPPTGKARRLPQCIVMGAPKTGTYTLKTFLGFHPDIVIPAEHEIRFFNVEENYAKGFSWYIRQMSPSLPGQVTLEKSPQYFYSYPAAERIYRMNKDIKLMLMVRQPLDRAISAHVHHVEKMRKLGQRHRRKFKDVVLNRRTGSVNASAKCIETSLYSRHLSKWLKLFNRDQIHIIDGDKLTRDPASELQLVEQYLGVGSFFQTDMFHYNKEKGFYCLRQRDASDYCMPSSKGRPHPDVDSDTRNKLLKFFKPYNEKFYEMTQRRFNWTAEA